MRFKRTTKKFVLSITTQNDIFDKYPNFRWNWNTPEEFIAHLCKTIEADGKDGVGKNSFGYSVRVKAL